MFFYKCYYLLTLDSKCNGEFLTATLTETGTPILIMAKNRSFFYSLETQCWHVVPSMGNLTGDGSHLFLNAKSVFSGSMRSALNEADDLTGPLSMIQSRTKTSRYTICLPVRHNSSKFILFLPATTTKKYHSSNRAHEQGVD